MSRNKFAVIDSETDPFLFGRTPKPFIWGFYDGRNFKTFRDTKQLVNFLRNKKITVYGHNLGKFDAMFMLDEVNTYYQPTIINNRLSKLRIGKCTLLDSYNILPVPLADYQKDEIDYGKFEADVREQHMEEITDYLRSDCVYLYDLVAAYREEYGADVTQASGALKTYQKMRGDKVPRHNDKSVYELFKHYYHGGRVQCFKTGIIEEPFSVYDINSAYPFAMTYKHPYGLDYVYGDRELPFTDDERVFYKLECISKGAFPYREKPTSGIEFPSDDVKREYYITDWEYWTAKNANLISEVKIIECVVFPATTDFADYVNKFYNGRLEAKACGDKVKDLLYKLRLNSLYGKFGSDYRKYEKYFIVPKDCELEEWEEIDTFGKDNKLVSQPLSDEEMKFLNVATAASITGFVRAYWLAGAVNVGFDNVLYGDTDSMSVLGDNGKKLNIGKALGQWKHEGKCDKAGIAGKKLYIFRKDKNCDIYKADKKKNSETSLYKKACKGADLTDSEMWRVCKGNTVKHRRDSPSFSVTGKVRFVERNIKMTNK